MVPVSVMPVIGGAHPCDRRLASFCCLLLAIPPVVRAQAAGPARLDQVEVTATRTPQRVDDSLADVTVIDRKQLDEASGLTLPQVLAQQPGVQFWSNGGFGSVSAVSLRGLEARNTLLLIDGVRYGSATVGAPSWENIPLESIERIEIVRGPLSGLYGSDAVGGVVQIFTRKGAPGVHADGLAMVGSNSYWQLGGGVRFAHGRFDGAANIARLDTKGYSATNAKAPFGNFNPDDDGFDQTSGAARFGWQFAEHWRLDASFLQANGETQYDDGLGADSRAKLKTQVVSAQASGRIGQVWNTTLRASSSTDQYDTIATASVFTPLGTTETVQRQLTWENTVATPIGLVLALAERLEQEVSRPGEPFEVSERSIDAVGVGLNGMAGPHGWQASLRYDRNSQFGSQTTGALAYGYDLTPAWRVAASYGTSFAAPSFNQLYFPGFGNPNLLPEEGKSGEVSLRWALNDRQQVRLAYFDNHIRGYIASGPAPTNIPKTRVDGVSLSYEGGFMGWTLAASADYIDPRNTTAGSPDEGNLLPRRAKQSARLAADSPRYNGFSAGATFSAFSHRYDDPANRLRIGGYGVLDLRADWRFLPAWNVALTLNNVFDKNYETVYGYNQPGREVYLTLRYSGTL
jgi:vitamin B12 transporter